PGKAPLRSQNPDSSRALAVRNAYPAIAWSSNPSRSRFLLRPWRYDTVGARIGDRLAEVLVLVPEKVADSIFPGHTPAYYFPRRFQSGVRKPLDGLLQVRI